MNRLDDASRAQVRAADPARSSWVMANAGSGKTRVLTDRVARLLLAGTPPERILCLTYTRTAAAEMQARLFERLGRWALMADDALCTELQRLQEDPLEATPEFLARARRLFAQALETPGGLKIQTIHAFCDAILRRFPLEAGVSPDFRVIDERSLAALLADLREAMARRAEAGTDPAFDLMAMRMPDTTLDGLIRAIQSGRDLFPPGVTEAALAKLFGVAPGESLESLLARLLGNVGPGFLERLVEVLLGGSTNDVKAGERLQAALQLGETGALLQTLEGLLLTGSGPNAGTSRAGKFPTKATREVLGEDVELLDAMADRAEALRPKRLGLLGLQDAVALHGFARGFLDLQARLKADRGALDFDDLIAGVEALLRSGAAGWVLYRLDGGIDHILVDEAQDTSPAQWRIIEALSEEFFSGEGARPAGRTLFAVGDLKQSIYSFQGADPAVFAEMKQRVARRLEGLGSELHEAALEHSFRSAPAVLRVVDG
ncbi:MAG: double-strand break repair helicase AddA, partial [Alphaproteobacteria bacterium]